MNEAILDHLKYKIILHFFCWIHIPYVFIHSFDVYHVKTKENPWNEKYVVRLAVRVRNLLRASTTALHFGFKVTAFRYSKLGRIQHTICKIWHEVHVSGTSCPAICTVEKTRCRGVSKRFFFFFFFFCSHLQVKKEPLVTWRPLWFAWRACPQTDTRLTTCLLSVTDVCYETPQEVIMKRDFSTTHQRLCSRCPPSLDHKLQLCSGVTRRTHRDRFRMSQLMEAQEGIITRQTQM